MKKLFLLVPFLIFTMTACNTPTDPSGPGGGGEVDPINPDDYWFETYQNPVNIFNDGVLTRTGIADPSVVRGDDGYLYCFATGGIMLQSEDGCNWNIYRSNVIPRPTWGDSYYSGKIPNIWAPDVVKVKDKWIYYYSLSAWDGPCGIGYAVSDSVNGEYTDMGRLFDSAEIKGDYSLGVFNAIDPQVIVDDDGSVYMVFGSFRGDYLIQLTEDGMGLYNGVQYQKENKTLVAGQPTTKWDGAQYEGSYIFKKDGYYYYMGSTGKCCEGANSTYNVRVGRATNIRGPYIDSDGKDLRLSVSTSTYGDIVVYSKKSNTDVKGPGHNSIMVDDAGNYWFYAHAFLSTDNYGTRHLMMDKLLWDEKGFPYIENRSFSFYEELDGPWFRNIEN